ncbi:MAG: tRNA (adenosine(37)-N6)-threonylcarbamoyltransferase complex transferase subunit TsaD [Flavobacteriales bacterium]|nr:MAG: tRNA (adenosine(37)-N6)-threonylcarbamoyltransferase complex transferase subunit TsaD [Flavobacteriales bacterium]
MREGKPLFILGIESSCDETAAAVLADGRVLSNVIAGQEAHRQWGGVVPELASRAHQESIVPVVHEALRQAGIGVADLGAVAVTQGPGLIGALLVGFCYARSLSQALGIPLIPVDHLSAHALAHFIQDGAPRSVPRFPFLNLTVSGGHTQLAVVHGYDRMDIIGSTRDDAAGEAFDKGAKALGLPYPGGPLIDLHAASGDPTRFPLPVPQVAGLDMSFSGIKTAFAQTVRAGMAGDPSFVERELPHLCASLQRCIVDELLRKLRMAARAQGLFEVAISGGVSANSALRSGAKALANAEGWALHLPPFAYCTDNAAMVAMAGHFGHLAGRHAPLNAVPFARG